MAELYKIRISVRDEYHNSIKDSDGLKVLGVQVQLEAEDYGELEVKMKSLCNDLQVWMPTHTIDIYASLYNSISDTYMNMASYYGEEKRFVTH